MSSEVIDIYSEVKKIRGKFDDGIKVFAGDNKVICINGECVTLFNPSTQLTWDANGFLTEVRVTGVDQNGVTRSFKKILSWSPEGYLQSVSGWEEV